MRCFNFLDPEGNRVELMEFQKDLNSNDPA
jgi:hypothetical protein